MEVNIKAPTSEISAKDIVKHVWRLSVYRSKSNKCNKVFLLSRALIAKVNTRGVLPYISHIGMCRPKGHVLPILVWNRVWFTKELRECLNVFIVSIPNE